MSEAIDETIKEIAVRHGVILSKDDPVLILQTMNERLLEETRKSQQEMLAQFKEEMENRAILIRSATVTKADIMFLGNLKTAKETATWDSILNYQ